MEEDTRPLATIQISANITLVSDQMAPTAWFTAVADTIHIGPGATLNLKGFALMATSPVVVEGSLIMNSSVLIGNLSIEPDGTALFLNSVLLEGERGDLHEPDTPLVVNRGSLTAYYSLLGGLGENSPAVITLDAGQTTLGASLLFGTGVTPDPGGETACAGTAPVSAGYNGTQGCALTGPGDTFYGEGTDAIPVGELGCGTGVNVDAYDRVRPADDDGDGSAACDTGPSEGNFP